MDWSPVEMALLTAACAAGLHLTLSLFAGLREKRNVKVIIDATNFSIVARITMPPSEEASQSASLAAGDT